MADKHQQKPKANEPARSAADPRSQQPNQKIDVKQPPKAGAVDPGAVPQFSDGSVTNRATRSVRPTARPGVSGQVDHVHPPTPNSGFPNKSVSVAETDEYHKMYFPNQQLASPEDHPDQPNVIVNNPYGSEPQQLDTDTGVARYRRPDPQTTKADYQPDERGPEQREQDEKRQRDEDQRKQGEQKAA